MPRFNAVKTPPKPDTTNVAGGAAFQASSKLDLAQRLMTTLMQDAYYKTAEQTQGDIATMIATCEDPLFAAKAAVYTRHKGFLRSVTHLVAAEIAHRVKGEKWTRPFLQAVVKRPDDVTEILAYTLAKWPNTPLPNCLKDGLGAALSSFDGYQLAKYRGEGRAVSLIDAVNLCHPKHTPALSALMKGTLKPADTWETKLTAAGKAENKAEAKQEAWGDLISNGKLGIFAALRNLRNIAKQAPQHLNAALDILSDTEAIKKSGILPFQFDTAVRVLAGTAKLSNQQAKRLGAALEASLQSVPKFEGRTLVVVDTSGSMRNGVTPPIRHAALLGCVLWKTQDDADLMTFDSNARYVSGMSPADSLATQVRLLIDRSNGGATYAWKVFEAANKRYDRIILLSDMQCYGGDMMQAWKSYKQRHNCAPYLYSFNVAAQDGTLQFPEKKVFCLAGWSDSVLSTMTNLEADPQAFIKEIENVSF